MPRLLVLRTVAVMTGSIMTGSQLWSTITVNAKKSMCAMCILPATVLA